MKHWFMNLRPIKAILLLLHPHESTCWNCGLPWSSRGLHVVSLPGGRGFFAVCEHCYETMSDKELVQAYQDLWHKSWNGVEKPCSYIVFRNAYMKDIRARYGK